MTNEERAKLIIEGKDEVSDDIESAAKKLLEFNKLTGLNMRMLPEQARAVMEERDALVKFNEQLAQSDALARQLATAQKGLQEETTKSTSTFKSLFSSLNQTGVRIRDFRQAMQGSIIGWDIAVMMLGDSFTALDDSVMKTVKTVSSLVTTFAYLSPAALAITAVSAAFVALTAKSGGASKELQGVIQSLEQMGAKSTATQALADLTGATREQAAAALEAAAINPEYAASIAKIAKEATQGRSAMDAFNEAMGIKQNAKRDDFIGQFGQRALVLQNFGSHMDKTTGTTDRLSGAMGLAAGYVEHWNALIFKGASYQESWNRGVERAREVSIGTQEELEQQGEKIAQLNKLVVEGARDIKENARLQGIYANGIQSAAGAYRSYAESLKSANEQHDKFLKGLDKEASKQREIANERRAEIEKQHNKTLEDMRKDLDKRFAQMDKDNAKRVEELDKQVAEARADVGKEGLRIAMEIANRRVEIERQAHLRIAELDYATAKRLRSAQTENEADAIREEALMARAAIDRDVSEKMNALQEQKVESQKALTERLAEIETERQERLKAIAEELEERKAAMREDAAERRAELAERKREQLAAIEEQLVKETAAREERRKEELAAFNEQKARARQNYQDQLKSIFDTRTATQKLRDDWKEVEKQIDLATAAAIRLKMAEAGTPLPGTSAMESWRAGERANFASGISNFVVPPGFPNDSFRVGLTSGERVSVGDKNTTGGMQIGTVNLYGVNDPRQFMEQLRELLVQESLRG